MKVPYRIQNFYNIIESYPMKMQYLNTLNTLNFLKDFYEEKKSECSFFSYRLFGTTL